MLLKQKRSMEDILLDTFIYISLIFLLIITLYPFLNTIAVSFNEGLDSIKGGIYLWPRKFTTFNYKSLLGRKQTYHAAWISLMRTVLSTVLGVFSTAILAYTLSRKKFVLRKFISVLVVVTMYINGGLIPTYFVFRAYGLTNSFWVYVWPAILHAFNVIIVRTYIEGLPDSLIESARIDGANEFKIFLSIIMPLCMPVLAVVALFTAVAAWNAWFDVFIYNPSNPNLSTLAYELQKVLQSAQAMSASMEQAMSKAAIGANDITPRAIRATMTVIVTVPIAIVYPFLQKYFVHGLTLGGVKE